MAMFHALAGFSSRRAPAYIVLLGALVATPAAAQPDYAPHSRAWNGLASLLQVARTEGIDLETPRELDLSRVTASDAIFVVYPTRDLPGEPLGEFMKAGGRLAVADDFGHGPSLWNAYGIRRSMNGGEHAPHLRGNPNLPVAQPHPGLEHPLTRGVKALVTNHPAILSHPVLQPLFAFRGGGSVVLVGAVGEGRLVAISDPSIFINNMMQFHGDHTFAANLLRYLEAGRGGRVWLVTDGTPIVGHFGVADAPLPRLRKWLSQAASADAPPLALTMGSVLLVALFVLVATTSLPRRSPYDGSALVPPAAPTGGFLGRVAFFRDRPGNLLHPLLVYKFELEGELVRRLGLSGRPSLHEVLKRMRRHGVDEADVEAARDLFVELDHLRDLQDRPGGPPRISERRFTRMVETGERILRGLDSEAGTS